MFYQVALLCETEQGEMWSWLSHPISNANEAQMVVEYCKHVYPASLIGYAEAETIEGLEIWLKERNTPTNRASLPEEEESGPGGDRDMPYVRALPTSWKEQEALIRLITRRHKGELES